MKKKFLTQYRFLTKMQAQTWNCFGAGPRDEHGIEIHVTEIQKIKEKNDKK